MADRDYADHPAHDEHLDRLESDISDARWRWENTAENSPAREAADKALSRAVHRWTRYVDSGY